MRFAIFAVVVVLPEPWRPTISTGAGGLSIRIREGSFPSPSSVRTSSSWTILMTWLPGETDRMTAWPVAFLCADRTKVRTTGSATSASSSASRTSLMAAETSSSLSAPLRVRPSSTDESLSERLSNTLAFLSSRPSAKADAAYPSSSNGIRGRTLADGCRSWRMPEDRRIPELHDSCAADTKRPGSGQLPVRRRDPRRTRRRCSRAP